MVFTLASGRSVSKLSKDIDPVTAALASGIRLSPREAECLRWFAEGMPMQDIPLMLDISYHSVWSYIDAATNKLGAANNRQAGTIATRIGLIYSQAG